ncbi:peptide chain release factor 3 [Planctomicrobium piriforme]|uniref:Peptide chain release factor 3 n=1 Tax=Planctomicrobium piriforme TaxID=1576369 RepID=A0A1I3BDV4_9PLAN|nr:peptide chain release factor 3 [Planctomicrobium piriforme]SFH60330.1 peptide chain release factor 3 [Planctomicrobium piriforme]
MASNVSPEQDGLPSIETATSSDPVKQRRAEIARRRSFGIIAHPDAGKTTLTEKILLYSGRIEEAGAVRGRKTQRAARSDWMKMEQERGISVTATCLCFDYDGYRLNLLDTPGHQDFSEDTYRTLNAVDTAVMVVDAVNGIESQTIKLFKICAERKIPIITFVNKMDRPGGDPLRVLTDIENVLGIDAIPVNWPIGTGRDFNGLVDRLANEVIKFSPVLRGAHEVPVERAAMDDAANCPFPPEIMDHVRDEVSLLEGAGVPFQNELFLKGNQTPVFFGSALTNFGVEQFLQGFVRLAPPPSPRMSDQGLIDPTNPNFTGLVFKIQANLDPRHHDRVAFVRVCSGRFERDMEVTISRTGERLRIPRSHQLFAAERETVDEAYPGDVIGIVNPGKLRLGDTICGGKPLQYRGRWEYAPERFVRLRCADTSKRKQFTRGVTQLIEEGAVQLLSDGGTTLHEPTLGAVGELQFDVVQFRLASEYNAQTTVDRLPFQMGRWIETPNFDVDKYTLPSGSRVMYDQTGAPLLLFADDWSMDYFLRRHPDVKLSEHRPEV